MWLGKHPFVKERDETTWTKPHCSILLLFYEAKFHRAICSSTWAWKYAILQNFLWTALWLKTPNETCSWSFPIPGGKKPNQNNKNKRKKTQNHQQIRYQYLLDKKKKAMVGDSVKKTVPYITLSIYTHFFPKDKKMASIWYTWAALKTKLPFEVIS